MSDPEFPDAALPDLDYVDQRDPDDEEDEEPVIPRDGNRPTADGDLDGEAFDPGDTLEWRQSDAALASQLDGLDAGDLETAGDLDGPLSDYDALTDDQLSGAQVDPDDNDPDDNTEHEGPDLNADDSTDDGVGSP